MTAWPELLATALVGTDRRAATDTNAASDLLERAAASSVYRRAGARPTRGLAKPRPAPDETVPIASPAAAAWLAPLLWTPDTAVSEDASGLIAEWLEVAVARDRRVPPELLPALLDVGRRRRELRELIAAAGGRRAEFLAAQNPEWTYLTAELSQTTPDPALWHEGTMDQRAGYLASARRTNPTAARDELATDWPTLAPDDRAHLLSILHNGLEPSDEEFLERALDDRRREVRDVAADLLGQLSGSAYNKRMTDRARACLSVLPGRIRVYPPSGRDKSMQRDGIALGSSRPIGERAWWLEQILARTPLADLTDLAPADFLALSIEDDWTLSVHVGLAHAAAIQGNSAWAAALLDLLAPQRSTNRRSVVDDLCLALEPAEAVRRSIAVLRDAEARLGRILEKLLAPCPAPWPDDLASAALDGIATHARHGRMPYDIYAVCRLAAMRLPPDRASAVAEIAERFRADRAGHGRVDALDGLTTALRRRHEMLQEIW